MCEASLVRQVWRTHRRSVRKVQHYKKIIYIAAFPDQSNQAVWFPGTRTNCSFTPETAISAAGSVARDGSQCLGLHRAQPSALSPAHLCQRSRVQMGWLLLLAEAFLSVSSGKAQLSGSLPHWHPWLFLHWLKASTYALDLAEPPTSSPFFLWVNLTFSSTQPKPDFPSRSAFGYCSAFFFYRNRIQILGPSSRAQKQLSIANRDFLHLWPLSSHWTSQSVSGNA